MKRLAIDGRRWLRLRRELPVRGRLYNSGIIVELGAGLTRDDVAIALRVDRGRTAPLPVQHARTVGASEFLFAALEPAIFGRAGVCTLTYRSRGRTRRERFVLGPDRYAVHFDGVRDCALTGWVSPLFAGPVPEIRLVLDGVTQPVAAETTFAPELRFDSAAGGWDGFALPLPPRALAGTLHHLAVQVGGTVVPFGPWASDPRFSIDEIGPARMTGWFFDAATRDGRAAGRTEVRLEIDGETRVAVDTHARPDLRGLFGREAAAFAFADEEILPGSRLIAGPAGTGVAVGRLASRVDAGRAEVRALLRGGPPEASWDARQRLRDDRVVAVRRDAGGRTLAFEADAADAAGVSDALAAEAARPGEPPPVCVVVPIYDGLADLELCVASLLPQLRPGRARAILIDDGSPDPAVAAYLARLAAEARPEVTVLRNAENLGFIGTVNRGLDRLGEGEDCALVNADTILPPRALEKLARACHARPGIASVTPMSNNATVVSFPDASRPGPPILGLDVAALDAAFEAGGHAPVVAPTGIGFCLYLNRRALDEVGPLSTQWGRGYCEEVDWCLKARDLGWHHLVATDTFVVHEGSVSFGSAERLAILATNHARLEALYPEYLGEVKAFIAADPLEPVRSAVLARLLAARFARLTLHLGHSLGGGTTRYVDDLRALERAAEHEVGFVAPIGEDFEVKRLRIDLDAAGAGTTIRPDRFVPFLEGLAASGVAVDLHVNARFGHDAAWLDQVLSGRWPYGVTLHDFQWYCPRVHLVDGRQFYCGEPPLDVCRQCVASGVGYDYGDQNPGDGGRFDAWLAQNERILRGARRVLAPSRDTAERYARRLGLDGIAVLPHPEPRRPAPRARAAARDRGAVLRVALVGKVGHNKGSELLAAAAELAARERAPVHFTVIGTTPNDARLRRLGNVTVTGTYEPPDLGALLEAADPHFVFFSSVWPETYSYVLSEVWSAGYLVVAFDFGAPAERIRAQGGGLLIEPTRDPRVLLARLFAAREDLAALAPPPPLPPPPATLEAYHALADATVRAPILAPIPAPTPASIDRVGDRAGGPATAHGR